LRFSSSSRRRRRSRPSTSRFDLLTSFANLFACAIFHLRSLQQCSTSRSAVRMNCISYLTVWGVQPVVTYRHPDLKARVPRCCSANTLQLQESTCESLPDLHDTCRQTNATNNMHSQGVEHGQLTRPKELGSSSNTTMHSMLYSDVSCVHLYCQARTPDESQLAPHPCKVLNGKTT